MPSVQFSLGDLEHLLGKTVPRDMDGLNRVFAYVKGDVESIEEQGGDTIVSLEVKDSNHPDIWSVEGIARALRGFLKITRGNETRVTGSSQVTVEVDRRLRTVRPYIACGLVRNVKPSEEALKSWISLQEKMDHTYGRKRKRASIGYYQADMITPPLKYTLSRPEKTRFVPLGSTEEMSLEEIVEKHPKGVEYGFTVTHHKEWPILVDSEGQVLSFPPIINSDDLGHVTTETRNILVEVTGTSLDTVQDTLKVVVTTLAERGGKVYTCTQKYPYGPQRKTVTPDLGSKPFRLSVSYANRILGTRLSAKEASRWLVYAGYAVKKIAGDNLTVQVPSYRLDIMHQVDLIEDIAIALDLNTLKPEWPGVATVGGLLGETERLGSLAELMVGLGYQEVMTYSLSSPKTINEKMHISGEKEGLVELLNPSMLNYTIVRSWLLPSLMEFLSNNTHVEYPQRVFELGQCLLRDGSSPTGVVDMPRLGAVTVHSTAGFTEIRQSLDALLRSLGAAFTVAPWKHSSFLDGRVGQVMLDGRSIGMIGEVHPVVLKNWGLSLPCAAFELDPTKIA